MIDIILAAVIIVILGAAVHGTRKQLKEGGCAGCSGCNCQNKSNCPSQKNENE